MKVSINVMYANKFALLMYIVSTYRRIRFVTPEYVNDRYKAMLMAPIKKILNLYSKRVFNVNNLLVEPEFEPM